MTLLSAFKSDLAALKTSKFFRGSGRGLKPAHEPNPDPTTILDSTVPGPSVPGSNMPRPTVPASAGGGEEVLASCPAADTSAEVVATSAPGRRVHLLELYTSESCSSCPAADTWLSQLMRSGALWTTVVPVAFHVDYWNHLWHVDPFSTPQATRRQRGMAAAFARPAVYTPAVVVDGQERRGWGRARPDSPSTLQGLRADVSPHVPAHAPRQPPPQIQLSITRSPEGTYAVSLYSDTAPVSLYGEGEGRRASLEGHSVTVHLALLGCGIVSEVRNGENAGKRLTHDFTVLSWHSESAQFPASTTTSMNPKTMYPSAQQSVTVRFGDIVTGAMLGPKAGIAKRFALAAWAEVKGVPIQAAGCWI